MYYIIFEIIIVGRQADTYRHKDTRTVNNEIKVYILEVEKTKESLGDALLSHCGRLSKSRMRYL